MRNNRRWESTGWGLRASTFQKWWQSIQQDLGESRGQERKEPSLEFQEKAFSDIAWTGQSRGKSPNTAPSQTLSHACVLPAPGRDVGRMASGISCDLHPIFPHHLKNPSLESLATRANICYPCLYHPPILGAPPPALLPWVLFLF